jgi:hypothetical protein
MRLRTQQLYCPGAARKGETLSPLDDCAIGSPNVLQSIDVWRCEIYNNYLYKTLRRRRQRWCERIAVMSSHTGDNLYTSVSC